MKTSAVILIGSVGACSFYLLYLSTFVNWAKVKTSGSHLVGELIKLVALILLLVAPTFGQTSSEFRIADSGAAAFEPSHRPELALLPVTVETHRRSIDSGKLALIFGLHFSATLDAWSTRRALRVPGTYEGNPILRPFASSPAIYAATNGAALLVDLWLLEARSPQSQRLARWTAIVTTSLHAAAACSNLSR
jgi:hypothetical protein